MATTHKTKPAAEAAASTTVGQEAPSAHHGMDLPIPLVTPRLTVHKVRVPTPGLGDVMGAGRAVASHLPAPETVALFGGLGAMAVFGALSWPVAGAIGAATIVARRARAGRAERQQPAQTTTPAKAS